MLLFLISNIEYIVLLLIEAQGIVGIRIRHSLSRWIEMVILILIATIIHAEVNEKSVILFVSMLAVMISFMLILEDNIITLTIYSLIIIVSTGLLWKMTRCIVAIYESMYKIKLPDIIADILSQAILIILLLIISMFISKKNNRLKDCSFAYVLLLLAIIVVDCVSVMFLGDYVINELTAEKKWIIEFAYVTTILGIFVQLGLLTSTILSRDEHKEKEALNAKYLEEQKNHYDYLKNRELETKKFRHDINQQMTLMKTLYREGKIEQFEEILNSIDDRINTFTKHVSVGNDTADAIINQYVQEAENAGIKLSVEGHFPPDCRIAAVDICTVFANLLSNAIRAERDANGDEVKLTVRNLDNELFVEVRNDYITEVKRSGERFMSTKKDRANHGLGLQNVYDCVERNRGVIHITTDNQIFDVKLNLKNTEA